MTGEDLYNLYVEALDNQGVEADPWEHLDAADQRAWDALAGQVKPS